MKEKTESQIIFDDRRKLMIHTIKETKDTDLGELVVTSKGTYNEDSIKKILSNLKEKKQVLEKNVKMLKELQESPKMNPELQLLKDKLKILQLISHKEDVSEKDKLKEISDLIEQETSLKKVNKDIEDIKNAIQTRLKL